MRNIDFRYALIMLLAVILGGAIIALFNSLF